MFYGLHVWVSGPLHKHLEFHPLLALRRSLSDSRFSEKSFYPLTATRHALSSESATSAVVAVRLRGYSHMFYKSKRTHGNKEKRADSPRLAVWLIPRRKRSAFRKGERMYGHTRHAGKPLHTTHDRARGITAKLRGLMVLPRQQNQRSTCHFLH